MRVDHRLFRAGVFLVLLGIPALLVQSGVVEANALASVPRLWPLVLIAIGVGLLLRFTPFATLGGVRVAGTLGVVIGTALAAGTPMLGSCVGGSVGGPGDLDRRTGSFGSPTARVDLEIACGDLTVSTRPGVDWEIATGREAGGADVVATDSELTARSGRGGVGSVFRGDQRARWEVVVPTGPRVDLDVAVSAGSGRLGLGGAGLGTLDVDVNAGNATLDLAGATVDRLLASVNAGNLAVLIGQGADVSGSIDVNAGNVELCVPAGIGIELVTEEALAGNDFAARGLTRTGDTWRSADFDSAPSRVRLQLSTNVGNASLNPEDGCGA